MKQVSLCIRVLSISNNSQLNERLFVLNSERVWQRVPRSATGLAQFTSFTSFARKWFKKCQLSTTNIATTLPTVSDFHNTFLIDVTFFYQVSISNIPIFMLMSDISSDYHGYRSISIRLLLRVAYTIFYPNA